MHCLQNSQSVSHRNQMFQILNKIIGPVAWPTLQSQRQLKTWA